MGVLDAMNKIRGNSGGSSSPFQLGVGTSLPEPPNPFNIPDQPGPRDNQAAKYHSGAQFPAGAAEESLEAVQRRATSTSKLLFTLGIDPPQDVAQDLSDLERAGQLPREKSFFENVVNVIGGPYRFVNLAIQDVLDGHAKSGKVDPEFSDYLGVLFGRTGEQEIMQKTGLEPFSGSKTLELAGIPLADEGDTFGKVARFVGTFLFEVAVDPLTYITFGASTVSRKILGARGIQLIDETMENVLRKNVVKTSLDRMTLKRVNDYAREVQKVGSQIGSPVPWEKALERAEEVVRLGYADEVVQPLIARDFANILDEAYELLPAYGQGGMRLFFPFRKVTSETGKRLPAITKGLQIPGTVGVGKKVGDVVKDVADAFRKNVPGGEGTAKFLDDISSRADLDKALIKGVKEGRLSGAQYVQVQDAINSGIGKKHMAEEIANINNAQKNLAKAADALDIDADDLNKILWTEVTKGPRGKAFEQLAKMVDNNIPGANELRRMLTRTANETRDRWVSLFKMLADIDEEYRPLLEMADTWMPQTFTPEARLLLYRIAEKAPDLAKLGSTDSSAALILGQILNTMGGAVHSPSILKTSAKTLTPQIGEIPMMTLSPSADGLVGRAIWLDAKDLSDIPQAAEIQQIMMAFDQNVHSSVVLNDLLENAVKELAEQIGVKVPKGGHRLFQENPFQAMIDVTQDLTDTARQLQLVDTLWNNGLITNQPYKDNVFDTILHMRAKNTKENFGKMVESSVKSKLEAQGSYQSMDVRRAEKKMSEAIDATYADAFDAEVRNNLLLDDERLDNGLKAVFYDVENDRWLVQTQGETLEDVLMEYTSGNPLYENESQLFEVQDLNDYWVDDVPVASRAQVANNIIETFERFAKPLRELGFSDNFDILINDFKNKIDVAKSASTDLGRGVLGTTDEALASFKDDLDKITRELRSWDIGPDGQPEWGLAMALDDIKTTGIKPTPVRPAGHAWKPGGQAARLFSGGGGSRHMRVALLADPEHAADVLTEMRYGNKKTEVFVDGEWKVPGGGRFTADQVIEIRKEVYEATQESLKARGVPEEVVVWRQSHGGEREMQRRGLRNAESYSLPRASASEFKDQTPWLVKREDILADSRHIDGVSGFEVENEIFIITGTAKELDPDDFKKITDFSKSGVDLPDVLKASSLSRKSARTTGRLLNDALKADRNLIELVPQGKLTKAKELREGLPNTLVSDNLLAVVGSSVGKVGSTARERIERFARAHGFEHLSGTNAMGSGRAATKSAAKKLEKNLPVPGAGRKATDWAERIIDMPAGELREAEVRAMNELFGTHVTASLLGTANEILNINKMADELVSIFKQIRELSPQRVLGSEDVLSGGVAIADQEAQSLFAHAREMAENFGLDPDTFELVKTPVAGKGGYVNPKIFGIGGKAIADSHMQRDVALWFEQTVRNMASAYTPVGMAMAKKTLNETVHWWKTMTTITRPTFHIRNVIGGVWNNQILGVGAGDYLRVRHNAVVVRNRLRKGANLHEALEAISDPSTREMFWAAWESGLLDQSFSRVEFRGLTNTNRREMAKKIQMFNPGDADNFVLAQWGSFGMESIEDFLRLSAFSAWFDPAVKNGSLIAKEMAIMAHFDYSKLTEYETIIKQFVPFFVWFRRNIPLQTRTMLEQPGIIQRYSHLMQSFDDQFEEIDQDSFGESAYWNAQVAGTDIVLHEDTPFWARVMFDPDLPITDLLQLDPTSPSAMWEQIKDMVGPQFMLPFELAEQTEYNDVNAPAPLNQVMASLADHGFFNKTLDGDVQIPFVMRSVYNTAFPWAREYNEILLSPSDPRQQARVGDTQEDQSLLRRFAIGIIGKGLGFKLQTPADTSSQAFKGNDRITEIIRDLRLSGQIAEPVEEEKNARYKFLFSGR